jgi:hypothetical protein
MMRDILHKILSVFLSFTVLFSTLSFSVDQHVCMGEVTDTSYFSDADSCGMIMEVEDCAIDGLTDDKVQREKCCNDIHELIPGNQTEQKALQSFEIEKAQFLLVFYCTYINLLEDDTDELPFRSHSPPLVDKDINVLYQTFLI